MSHRTDRIEQLMIAAGLIIAICVIAAIKVHGAEPPVGTVYVTRNLDESQNTSPGYWNHLAIYVGNGEVVEAQSDGVIVTRLNDLLQRPIKLIRLLPRTAELGQHAADAARRMVGRPYGALASVGPLWRLGRRNCVSVIELAYDEATGKRWWWIRRPDHVWRLVRKP